MREETWYCLRCDFYTYSVREKVKHIVRCGRTVEYDPDKELYKCLDCIEFWQVAGESCYRYVKNPPVVYRIIERMCPDCFFLDNTGPYPYPQSKSEQPIDKSMDWHYNLMHKTDPKPTIEPKKITSRFQGLIFDDDD